MADRSDRDISLDAFEADAELLAVYQIDLLAQLEAQIRAVHQTMRSIENSVRRSIAWDRS